MSVQNTTNPKQKTQNKGAPKTSKSTSLNDVLDQLRRADFKAKKPVTFKIPVITKKLAIALAKELQMDQGEVLTNALIFYAQAHTSVPRNAYIDLVSMVDELTILVEHQQSNIENLETLFSEVPNAALESLESESLPDASDLDLLTAGGEQ